MKLRDRPIGQKLVIIIMFTTAVALLLAGSGLLVADSLLFRQSIRRDLAALSEIVADNSSAALAFDDQEAATQTLNSLRARPHVAGACVYRLNGSVLAGYARDRVFACPPIQETPGVRASGPDELVSQPVRLAGRQIGTLMLLYDLKEIGERNRLYTAVMLGILFLSSLMALLLSRRLRNLIATPVSRLVSATTAVSETGDYSIRAEKVTTDELGLLVDRFNEMLAGIQSRDA